MIVLLFNPMLIYFKPDTRRGDKIYLAKYKNYDCSYILQAWSIKITRILPHIQNCAVSHDPLILCSSNILISHHQIQSKQIQAKTMRSKLHTEPNLLFIPAFMPFRATNNKEDLIEDSHSYRVTRVRRCEKNRTKRTLRGSMIAESIVSDVPIAKVELWALDLAFYIGSSSSLIPTNLIHEGPLKRPIPRRKKNTLLAWLNIYFTLFLARLNLFNI